ncbi:MAG: hypothetical protein KDA24_24375, partial [Deltaproteobacteria bacterium]|nr:hypothetical protein [Deltaproteobacteria bacterium]
GRVESIPPTAPEHWLEHDEAQITLHTDGSADVDLVWRFEGMRANERASEAARSEAARWEQGIRRAVLKAWPGAEILEVVDGPDADSASTTWTTRVSLKAPQIMQLQGQYGVVRLPWVHARDPGSVPLSKRRFYPFVLAPLHQRSTLRFTLPRGASVLALPAPGGEERDDWRSELTAVEEAGGVTVQLTVQEHPGPMEHGLGQARRNFVASVGALQDRVLVIRQEAP